MTSTTVGRVSTAVLHTLDLPDAERFYAAVFGWAAERHDTEVDFTLRGHRMAVGRATIGAVGGWVPYVRVESVSAATELAVAAGASLEARDTLDAEGHSAVFADLEGAMLGVCDDDRHAVSAWDVPGSVWWVEVLAHMPAALEAFYGGVFGWASRSRPLDPHPVYVVWTCDGQPVAGLLPIHPDWDVVPRWQVLFAVDDLTGAVARVERAGGAVEFGPLDIPGVTTLTSVRDPQGHLFVLSQPRPAVTT
jgi:uncharacterized protein